MLGTIFLAYIGLHELHYPWKERPMNEIGKPVPPRHPSKGVAGGFFIFVGLIIGSTIGIIYEQPSIGMVSGMASGGIVATIIWLLDRRGH